MKRVEMIVGGIFALAVFFGSVGAQALGATKAKPASCPSCHEDFKSVLPQGHSPVSGKDITACFSCHLPSAPGKAELNPFSTRIHRAHINSQVKVDCLICHTWVPGKSLGLPKQKVSWGALSRKSMEQIKKIFHSWSESDYLDALHARKNVICGGCHGPKLPETDDTVENERCVSCHGSYEKLEEKTAAVEFPKRNPHKSHLLALACTKCHSAHSASKVYCLECHHGFQMKISGGSQQLTDPQNK